MTERHRPRAGFDVPLFWKLLVPYLTLVVAVGSFGAYLIVHDVTSRAEAALDRDLSGRAVDVAALVHERELYVLESVSLAANLEGMDDAVRAHDHVGALRLARSVLALKRDVNLLVVTDRSGLAIEELRRSAGDLVETSGSQWSTSPPIAAVLGPDALLSSPAFLSVDGASMLAVAAPVCGPIEPCAAVGAVMVAVRSDAVASSAVEVATRADGGHPAGIALFGPTGDRVAGSGTNPAVRPLTLPSGRSVRRTERRGGQQVVTLYSALRLQGRDAGQLAVTVPRSLPGVDGAARRVAMLVLAAIAGVVAIGALLTRFLLTRLRAVLDVHRALGAGDLTARAPVLGSDELGELAEGVNEMAAQLQASHEDLELRVSERTAEVQRLLEARTDLFNSVSHELRTPLAVILAHSEAMQDPSYRRTARWTAATGATVEASARQLLDVVNELLDLARAEAGAVEIDMGEVRLADVVRDLRGTIDGLAGAAGLDVTVRIPAGIAPMLADPVRLREIVLNLVDNAVKYTPTGGAIELAARNGGGRIELSVSDTGVGIPDDVGDRVYEPFFRVRSTRTQRSEPSSGLGLAVTKRLVEAQGGSITFAARPGGGTTFVVTFEAAPRRPRRERRSATDS